MKQIFESATTYTNILFLQKAETRPTIKMCRVDDSFDIHSILEDYVDYLSLDIENPGERSWISYEKEQYELIKKIISQGKPLKDWDIKINRGILTGYNNAFVINTEIRNNIIAGDPKSAEIIKPLLRGEDVKAYVPEWHDLWLIGTFPSLNIDINQYPGIKEHLLPFQERLTPKPQKYNEKLGKWKGRKSGSYEWFETQDSIGYYEDFLKPKIIYPNMTKYMPFVYDKHQFFTNQKCFIITGRQLSYLTAFLNSKIFRFAFKDYFPELLGDTKELSKVFFETVAIKEVNEKTNDLFDVYLQTVVNQKKNGQSYTDIENEIDSKLVEIYSLNDDDVKLINVAENSEDETNPFKVAISELVKS